MTRVDGKAYSKVAVLSAAYRQSDHFFVSVDFDGGSWLIRFTPRCQTDAAPKNPIHAFLDDLVDYQLRHEMDQSFRPLRELIATKAFAGLE